MDETEDDYMMQNKPVLQTKNCIFCHLWIWEREKEYKSNEATSCLTFTKLFNAKN